MNRVAIYCLIDPRSGAIRYAGASNEPPRRLREHFFAAKHAKRASAKREWFRELLAANLRPTIEILEWTDGRTWEARERYWIARLRAEGHDLVNVANGGAGMRFSPELAERSNRSRRGIVFSEERNAKIASAHRGRKRTDAHKAAISAALKGRAPSDATRRAQAEAVPKRYTLTYADGRVVTVKNLRRFCRENGVSHGSLYALMRGERRSLNGIVKVERLGL